MPNYFDLGRAEQLHGRLRRLEPAKPALWGAMTAHEMIVHLRDGLELALGRRTAQSQGPMFFHTALGRWLALGPIPWQRGAITPREMNRAVDGTPLQRAFEEDFRLLELRLEEFARASSFYPHPFFGDLNRRQWGALTWKHLDHHLQQFGC
jgi:hypothetical protein